MAFAETVVDDPDYVCAAGQFCRSVGNHTSSRSPCMNCNELAHHFCAEYWSEQNPVEPHLVITVKDLSKGGKLRLKNTPSAQKCDVMFCILCESRWKAIKVSAAAKIAAKKSKRRPIEQSSTPSEQRAPTKKKRASATTAPVAVIRELRRVAAFYSQVYIFTKVEKAKANLRFALIEEHFYGNPQKRIKGACEMLLDGEGPFAALYNVVEGDFDRELVLKASCCGKANSELKLKTSVRMSSADSEAQVNFAINLLMEKLEDYHGVLKTMMEEKRTINPIVGTVLSMAATAMGLAKGDEGATAIGLEKGDDDDIELNTADFVSDMLK